MNRKVEHLDFVSSCEQQAMNAKQKISLCCSLRRRKSGEGENTERAGQSTIFFSVAQMELLKIPHTA